MASIPIIDLSDCDRDGASFAQTARRIADACETIGFFGLTGHGVAAERIAATERIAERFFALPLDRKMAVLRPRPGINRAYIPYGTETLARLAGNETPPDYKEVYAMGLEGYPDEPYFNCDAALPHFARNRWPVELPEMPGVLGAYWDDMQRLARRVMSLSAHALSLPPDYFDLRARRDPSQLRLIHYPPYRGPWESGQLRAGVHTDLGLLSIVHSRNNRIGGLEVQDRGGAWLAVPEFDGFVVNIGDSLMRWCNDRWRSTPHRVANPPPEAGEASARTSLVFFFIADYDSVIAPIASCVDAAHPPKYPPVTVGEYRAARFARTAGSAPSVM
jgi:isopenicillin N synthase-like dioxygenase